MSAIQITTYSDLRKIAKSFVRGKLQPLLLVGPPGQSKTQTMERAFGKVKYLLLKGRTTPVCFVEKLYRHLDMPVVLDDTSEMLKNNEVQELLRELMENTPERKVFWDTQSPISVQKGLPKAFTTRSPVCVIANQIGQGGVWPALISRCVRFNVEFSWKEICREVRRIGWFSDKEILVYAENQATCQADVRKFNQAKMLKENNLQDWRQLFHATPVSLNRADMLVDKVFGLVAASPSLSRRDLHNRCGNILKKVDLDAALQTLIDQGRILSEKCPSSGGRPPVRFRPVEATIGAAADSALTQQQEAMKESLLAVAERTKFEEVAPALCSFVHGSDFASLVQQGAGNLPGTSLAFSSSQGSVAQVHQIDNPSATNPCAPTTTTP